MEDGSCWSALEAAAAVVTFVVADGGDITVDSEVEADAEATVAAGRWRRGEVTAEDDTAVVAEAEEAADVEESGSDVIEVAAAAAAAAAEEAIVVVADRRDKGDGSVTVSAIVWEAAAEGEVAEDEDAEEGGVDFELSTSGCEETEDFATEAVAVEVVVVVATTAAEGTVSICL